MRLHMKKLFFIAAATLFTCTPYNPLFASAPEAAEEVICNDLYEEAIEVLEQVRTILLSLVRELNAQYKTEITLHDACEIVRQNIDKIGIEPEDQEIFLLGLEIIETGDYSKLAQLDKLLDEIE
jgi:hypothetical protein